MGHYDEDAIEALLPHELAYIGLIASRRRFATVLDVLAGRGMVGLERVRRAADSSVGGSQEEIALATLAEIVAARHVRQRSEAIALRSEEHTSELQSLRHLVCRLLLEKK